MKPRTHGGVGPDNNRMWIFRKQSRLKAKLFVSAGMVFLLSVMVAAQSGPSPTIAPPPPTNGGDDSDPTRPVVWSLRADYYNLQGKSWNNAFLLRVDRAFLKERPRLTGKRGVLTRVDIPLVVARRPNGTSAGLGDIYAQALLLPYSKGKFVFAAGSGVLLPTATDRRLGTGKLTIAPAAAPIWFIPRRGFFLVKVQDYVSVAGAHDRPDLHYMTITPLLVWRLKGKPYWTQLDAETQTNWRADGHTGYKAGVLFGRMTKKRMGAWIKIEVGMGPYRVASLAIKTSLFRVH